MLSVAQKKRNAAEASPQAPLTWALGCASLVLARRGPGPYPRPSPADGGGARRAQGRGAGPGASVCGAPSGQRPARGLGEATHLCLGTEQVTGDALRGPRAVADGSGCAAGRGHWAAPCAEPVALDLRVVSSSPTEGVEMILNTQIFLKAPQTTGPCAFSDLWGLCL